MGEENKNKIENALNLIGVEPAFLIRESFLGYKFRKTNHKLYENDYEIPVKLIRLYYGLTNRADFNTLQKAFVTHYIHQESKLEGLDTKSAHSKAEIEGLEAMYEYIHSGELEQYLYTKKLGFGTKRSMFANMPKMALYDSTKFSNACLASTGLEFTLMELHDKLYSLTEHKEYGSYFRNEDCYLAGTDIETTQWLNIGNELKYIDIDFQKLLLKADIIKDSKNLEEILKFIDECIVLKCRIIKVHPFFDGNGRTVRGLVNILFEKAGLPPIYINANEKIEYQKAMHKTDDNDYKDIKQFYKYKICDSIVELDINNRVKQEKNLQMEFDKLTEDDQRTYEMVKRMTKDMQEIKDNSIEIDKDGVKIYKLKRETI